MRAIILMLLIVGISLSAHFKGIGFYNTGADRENKPFIEEWNRYNRGKLERLTDSLINGEIDTTLEIRGMVEKLVNTSRMANRVKLVIRSIPSLPGTVTLGLYNRLDSTLTINADIEDKGVALHTVIHELTHAVQFQHEFYGVGRKAVIIGELYADYIAARKLYGIYKENILDYNRRVGRLLMLYSYFDLAFVPEDVAKSKWNMMIFLINGLSNRVKE